MTQVKVKTECLYQNHNIAKNKAIKLILKAPYTELTNYIGTVQMVNENTSIVVKVGSDKKPLKLGTFSLQAVNIDKDGNGKITWLTQIQFAELENLNILASRNDEPQMYMFKADIVIEAPEEEELLEYSEVLGEE